MKPASFEQPTFGRPQTSSASFDSNDSDHFMVQPLPHHGACEMKRTAANMLLEVSFPSKRASSRQQQLSMLSPDAPRLASFCPNLTSATIGQMCRDHVMMFDLNGALAASSKDAFML